VGVLLKPTPDMGSWSVEIFTESARLWQKAQRDRIPGCEAVSRRPARVLAEGELPALDPDTVAVGVTFAAPELLPLVAALDQVLADEIYVDYARHGGFRLGQWAEPETVDGWVLVRGPVLAPSTHIGERSFVLHYAYVAELRYMLAVFANHLAKGDAI